MNRFLALSAAACVALVSAFSASAQDVVTYDFDGSFEDATFAVETAIVGRGLVVDHVSHVGEMLERTRADVGSDVTIFDAADVYLFCSAVVSRSVMEVDPLNIVYCPYNVFVTDRDGKVQIGHPSYPQGAMQEVQTLLSEIATEAGGE